MSEQMDRAVLTMPYELAMDDELSRMQFWSRVQLFYKEQSARIEELESDWVVRTYIKGTGDFVAESTPFKTYEEARILRDKWQDDPVGGIGIVAKAERLCQRIEADEALMRTIEDEVVYVFAELNFFDDQDSDSMKAILASLNKIEAALRSRLETK